MAEEIELEKRRGKGKSINQSRRNSILNSNTKLGNQARVISPKTNMLARSFLTNPYLTAAPEGLISWLMRLGAGPTSGLLAAFSPTEAADGTIPEGYFEELKALDAKLKAQREAEQLAAAKLKMRSQR